MIRNSKVPVLVIKAPIEKEVKKIVFASDFTDVSVESFNKLIEFASVLDAHIDLLHVDTPKLKMNAEEVDQNMQKLVDAIEAKDGSIDMNHIEATTVDDGINQFAEENDIDLVAICTHGKSGLQQLLSPSIAERVANHTHYPLLSIHL